jgi:hypothetical protein
MKLCKTETSKFEQWKFGILKNLQFGTLPVIQLSAKTITALALLTLAARKQHFEATKHGALTSLSDQAYIRYRRHQQPHFAEL